MHWLISSSLAFFKASMKDWIIQWEMEIFPLSILSEFFQKYCQDHCLYSRRYYQLSTLFQRYLFHKTKLGLAMSLICGKSDICLGAAKFAWKNLLKRNAFRIDVWTKEVSKYTFSGIFFTFSFSPQQAPKTFRISWNILGTFFYEAIVFVINQIF